MIDASQPPCPIFDSDLASCGEVSWFKFCCSRISFFPRSQTRRFMYRHVLIVPVPALSAHVMVPSLEFSSGLERRSRNSFSEVV